MIILTRYTIFLSIQMFFPPEDVVRIKLNNTLKILETLYCVKLLIVNSFIQSGTAKENLQS